jgi:hypothetical protein
MNDSVFKVCSDITAHIVLSLFYQKPRTENNFLNHYYLDTIYLSSVRDLNIANVADILLFNIMQKAFLKFCCHTKNHNSSLSGTYVSHITSLHDLCVDFIHGRGLEVIKMLSSSRILMQDYTKIT